MDDIIRIREAKKADAERVVEMSHAVGAHEKMPAAKLELATFLAFGFGQDRIFHCNVAECREKLVGHACTTRGFDFQEGCPVFWLADLYVEPQFRRRGVGRSLMAAIAEQAQKGGASFVQWAIAPNNKLARDFYSSIGARDDHGQPMYLSSSAMASLVSVNS